METCPYPKLTTKMRISANQARKQTQEWICFRAFLRPYEQGYTGAVCRPVCRKINRLNCPVSSGRHRYICWSRGIFPGHSKQEKERFRMKSHNDHLTLTSGPESNPAGAALGHLPPLSRPTAGDGPQDAGRSICTSPKGARPPWELVSPLVAPGNRHPY